MTGDLWFVYDEYEGSFLTFNTQHEAKEYFLKLVADVKRDAEYWGEFAAVDGLYFGRVHTRAEVVDVDPGIDGIDDQTAEYGALVIRDLIGE